MSIKNTLTLYADDKQVDPNASDTPLIFTSETAKNQEQLREQAKEAGWGSRWVKEKLVDLSPEVFKSYVPVRGAKKAETASTEPTAEPTAEPVAEVAPEAG